MDPGHSSEEDSAEFSRENRSGAATSDAGSFPPELLSILEGCISECSGSGSDEDETPSPARRHPVASPADSSGPSGPPSASSSSGSNIESLEILTRLIELDAFSGNRSGAGSPSTSERSLSERPRTGSDRDDAQPSLSDSQELNLEDLAVWIEAAGEGADNEEGSRAASTSTDGDEISLWLEQAREESINSQSEP